jgi:hypothetical protein
MLDIWSEGPLVQILSYYYNELSEESGLLCTFVISVSYGLVAL